MLRTRVTRLGKILPFGQFFMAKFFLEKIAQWFGQNFSHEKIAQWFGQNFSHEKLPKIDLYKAKILFQKRFFTCLKNIQKILSPFLCKKKNYKRMSSAIGISIKSNRNTIKQFYIVNLTKTWLGDFLGDFSLSLGDFLTETSGHPDRKWYFSTKNHSEI